MQGPSRPPTLHGGQGDHIVAYCVLKQAANNVAQQGPQFLRNWLSNVPGLFLGDDGSLRNLAANAATANDALQVLQLHPGISQAFGSTGGGEGTALRKMNAVEASNSHGSVNEKRALDAFIKLIDFFHLQQGIDVGKGPMADLDRANFPLMFHKTRRGAVLLLREFSLHIFSAAFPNTFASYAQSMKQTFEKMLGN